MSHNEEPATQAVIVETDLQFSLHELGRVCGVEITVLEALVHEGVLTPRAGTRRNGFSRAPALPQARMASRLARDLDLSAAGTALVMDLLAEIDALRAQLRRLRG